MFRFTEWKKQSIGLPISLVIQAVWEAYIRITTENYPRRETELPSPRFVWEMQLPSPQHRNSKLDFSTIRLIINLKLGLHIHWPQLHWCVMSHMGYEPPLTHKNMKYMSKRCAGFRHFGEVNYSYPRRVVLKVSRYSTVRSGTLTWREWGLCFGTRETFKTK